MYFLKNVCFLCLNNHKNLKFMSSVDNNGIVIEDKLKCCFPEIAAFVPEIPKSICTECNNKLHTMYEFKQSVLQNNTYFQDYINKLQIHNCAAYQQLQIVVKDIRKCESPILNENFTSHEEVTYLNNSNTAEEHSDNNGNRISEPVKDEAQEMLTDNMNYPKPEVILLKSEIDIKEEPDPEENIPSSLEEETEEPNTEEQFPNLQINMKVESDENKKLDPLNTESECSFEDTIKVYNETEICNKNIMYDALKHQCRICGNRFNTKSNLDSHLTTHSKSKRYQCKICGHRFSVKACLDTHQIVHSDVTKHKCDICGKKFRHSMTFISHKRIHSGELFECNVCKKKFARKFDLDRHQLIHSDNKPYKCNLCGKSYIRRDKLRIHMGSH